VNYIIGDVVVLTSGSSDTLTITVTRDMKVTKIGFDSTGIFKITNSDLQGLDDFCAASAAQPILGRALSDNGVPLVLDEPLDIPKGTSLTFAVTDLSGAENTIGVALIGTALITGDRAG